MKKYFLVLLAVLVISSLFAIDPNGNYENRDIDAKAVNNPQTDLLVNQQQTVLDAPTGVDLTAEEDETAEPLPLSRIEVFIGDENSTLTSYQDPINFYYCNSLSETMYYAEELEEQGVTGGAITGIEYYTNFSTNLPGMPINIWMGETELNDLSAGWIPAGQLTQVFSGNLDFLTGEQDITVEFEEPFISNGLNIVVMVERVMDTTYYSTMDVFHVTASPEYPNRSMHAYSDGTDFDPNNPPANYYYVTFVPNTTLSVSTEGMGSLEGYAYNTNNNEPLEGVLVQLFEQRLQAYTDASGYYVFPGLFEGTLEAHATLFAHSEDIETVVIVTGETTVQDFYLQPAPQVEVTGRVVGSDYPNIGLAGAEVIFTGMGVHEGVTDADGNFMIDTVYSLNTYQLVVIAEGYEVLVGEAVIGATNTDLGDIIVNEVAFPAYDVIATQNAEDTVVDLIWHGPNPSAGNLWDFEDDNGDFVADNGWAWGTDSMSGAYSGTNVWGTVLNAQYANSCNYQLVTPEVSIPTDDAVLTFWHWYDIENYFDGGNVKISADGGSTWTLLTPVGGYPEDAVTTSNSGIPGEPAYSSNSNGWVMATFEIGAYQGEDVMIKFHFGSDSSVLYQGWYIDDVYIGIPETDVIETDNSNFNPIVSLPSQNVGRIVESYNVYRLLMGEEENEASWETISEAITDTLYSDPTWDILESEIYKYAVKTVYTNNVLADAAISNWVGKDMIATLNVTLTTNVGDIPAGASISLEATEPDPEGFFQEYSGVTDINGECTITGIWKSNYDLVATYEGFSTLNDNIDIMEDVVDYEGMVYEEANSPFDVYAEVNASDTECDLIWNTPGTWPEYEIIYDDDEGENATAWYDADNERSVWFTAQGGPCFVTGGSMNIYDGTWPAGNYLTPFTAAVWAYDEATGLPGEMLGSVEVVPEDCNWVPFEFDEPISVEGTEFFLGYIQGGTYPDCAPIAVDDTLPTVGRSYEHYATGGGDWVISSYQDFMLRALVMGPTGRQITLGYDNPTVDFSSVIPSKGALSEHASNLPLGSQEVGNASYVSVLNTDHRSGFSNSQANINPLRDRELLGYNVILGEFGDEANWPMWTQVNTVLVEDTVYTDTDWVNLDNGTVYTYGVRAVYTNNNQSDPGFSNWVGKGMYATLEISLTTNIGDIPAGAEISITATQPDPDGNYPEYSAIADDAGECTITGIWKGNYDLEAQLLNFADLEDNIDIMEDVVTYDGMITEMMYPAFDLYVEENHDGNAWLTWHSPAGALNSFFDFEDDNGEFVGEAGWEWAAGSNAGNAWSGENCWSTWPGADYPNNANTALYTPILDVPSAETQLMFYHWYDIESYWDGGNVKISTDEGGTWTIIDPIGAYPGTAVGLNGEVVYNGTSAGWVAAAFDLSMYEDQEVMFKFHFGSDSSVVYAGWDIDDVYIGEPETRGLAVALSSEMSSCPFSETAGNNRLERMDGYSLFRGFATDEDNFEDWDLIVSGLQDTTYEDTSWPLITEPGVYEYCVRAEYTGGVLSEPSFSNELGFNMFVPVSINVTTDSGDSANGAAVSLVSNDGLYVYEGVVSNGTVAWGEVWKTIYSLTVNLDGFEGYEQTDIYITDATTLNVTLNELIAPPMELAVNEGTGLMTWSEPSFAEYEILLEEGFETWPPAGWTFVDDDGDSFGWDDGGALGLDAYMGAGLAYSASYDNTAYALTPDNWLISPAISMDYAGQINYFVAAQDAAWAGEHYGVYVSTTGTDPADFTLLFEETMVARNTDSVERILPKGSRVQGAWYERTVPVDGYTGNIYLAFRHFNVTDMFYLDLDEVTVSQGEMPTRILDYYNVYLDGNLVGQTTETQFALAALNTCITGDDYTAGVSAHFSSGNESTLAEVDFTCHWGVDADDNVIMGVTALGDNYPNPFNPVTNLSYSLKETGPVVLEIYNVKGQKVTTLVNEIQEAGVYRLTWMGNDDNGTPVSSGMYFYTMKTGDYTTSKKMVLMK
ncbi:MAG: choice-of-anchor J domain-containing protein [Candidatus Cloacimonetes bacterium]|nr:choice-of-anchor J domain-containing protein [Candidatus Cloacimonadota bacterium]